MEGRSQKCSFLPLQERLTIAVFKTISCSIKILPWTMDIAGASSALKYSSEGKYSSSITFFVIRSEAFSHYSSRYLTPRYLAIIHDHPNVWTPRLCESLVIASRALLWEIYLQFCISSVAGASAARGLTGCCSMMGGVCRSGWVENEWEMRPN